MPPTNNPIEITEQFSINPESDHGLILQIKQQATWMIASGKLNEGDTLPSIRELAEHLNVNMHTVRQAYNRLKNEGLVDIQPRSKARILAYNPVSYIKHASKIETHTIGIIVPTLDNPFYHTMLQGIQSEFQTSDYLTYICPTFDDSALAWRYFARLMINGVDGVICVSHDLKEFIQIGSDAPDIPLVSADYPAETGFSVELDHEQSGFLATHHLIEHGCQRIALVRFVVDIPPILAIQRGYQKALEQAGITFSPELVIPVNDYGRASGAEAALHILDLPQRPDAVFIIADQMALGFLESMQESGIKIPEDIAVTSFNNIPEAAFCTPSLTTVAAPTEQLGRTAATMLSSLISGHTPEVKQVKIPCKELIIRQSCGCTQL